MQDILIPKEFKLSFIHQMDLVDLVVSLRAIGERSASGNTRQFVPLISKLKSIHSRLQQFNKVLNQYTQTLLLGLHKSLVGFLALILFLISSMLFMVNRFVSVPILNLCRNLSPCRSVSCMDASINQLIQSLNRAETENRQLPDHLPRLYQLSFIGSLTTHFTHELTNLSNGVINYTQALLDTDEGAPRQETQTLLHSLLREEKKIGRLSTNLLQFTLEIQNHQEKTHVGTLLNRVTSLLQEHYKSKVNVMKLLIDSGLPKISHHGSDIQLVLLMLLQNRLDHPNQTPIRISCHPADKDDWMIVTIRDQISPSGPGRTPANKMLPWSNRDFLHSYLASFGATMRDQIDPNDQSNHCTITLPGTCFKST